MLRRIVPRAAQAFLAVVLGPAAAAGEEAVLTREFVFEKAPFPECHASTIAELDTGFACAWFGGTEEGHPDVGIWLSIRRGGSWSEPRRVADGVQHQRKRYPCWNPVLFRPRRGPLLLFYKVGPSPSGWWGMLMRSEDGGKTWSHPCRLPEDILGPVKNKPVELEDGTLLCPSSSEHEGWRIHFERTRDLGRTWELIGPIHDGRDFAAIQPTILTHRDGTLQALCRSRQGVIVETRSRDGGRTWSPPRATRLPNPNSGIDAVTLRDGRHLLVYNHTVRNGPTPRGREMLNVAVSKDGENWEAALVLERAPGEFSYPAVIQSRDGRVHITYTWRRRRIRYVVLDPARLETVPISNGRWPGLEREPK